MKKDAESPEVDDSYKAEDLARQIEQVEKAKKDDPELYAKALECLEEKSDTIGSIADIRKRRQKLAREEAKEKADDAEGDEEE